MRQIAPVSTRICQVQGSRPRCFHTRGRFMVQGCDLSIHRKWEAAPLHGIPDPGRAPHCSLCFGAVPTQIRVCSHSPGLFSALFTTFQLFSLPELLGNDQELSRTGLEVFKTRLTTTPTSSCSQPSSHSNLPVSNPSGPLRLTLPHRLRYLTHV